MDQQLTPEEQQLINDEPYLYDAYSSPVSASDLLEKVTDQFEQIPSYAERFRDGREQF